MNCSITAIISLHVSDSPQWFIQAANSILDQTLPPAELIITRDGELSHEHYSALDRICNHHAHIKKTVVSSNANSRGELLRMAVDRSQTELVAIMDADDISSKNRFAKQVDVFKNDDCVDVVGSWIKEVYPESMQLYAYRKVPEKHAEIYKFSKYRNPVNQMTVMFKRQKVIAAGNYESFRYFEDMWLWVRMLNNNCIFYNIQQPLVTVRSGPKMAVRRSGFDYFKQEITLYKKFYKIGFLSGTQTVAMICLRAPMRLLPPRLLNHIFRHFIHDRRA